VYTDVWFRDGEQRVVRDGNGAAPGCGKGSFTATPREFRVCENEVGPDWCSYKVSID
jgi:hypothetical protein